MRILPEQKLLVAIYSEEAFKGRTIRQETPRCCNCEINLYQVQVRFREIPVGNRTFTLLEPRCPCCGRWINPVFCILN